MKKSRNLYLYFAIAIPIIMIAIVIFNVSFNRIKLNPQYHFIYMLNNTHPWVCSQQMKQDIFQEKNIASEKKSIDCSYTKFYEYDFTNGKSINVSLDDVKKMKLSRLENTISPDGYTIGYCQTSDVTTWFPGFSNNSVCIRKNHNAERLNMDGNNFFFIGWKLN